MDFFTFYFHQITRICPASQLDKPTLRRIFEAVGLNLPARLLVTVVRGGSDAAGVLENRSSKQRHTRLLHFRWQENWFRLIQLHRLIFLYFHLAFLLNYVFY